ncbi:MAG: citrate lyase holo-[acyl-carrier protein] synthase [Enterocloster sp.]
MKLNQIFCGSPASLTEILDARSRRAGKQKILLNTPGARCLISFSLNIPGETAFSHGHPGFRESPGEIRRRFGHDLLL